MGPLGIVGIRQVGRSVTSAFCGILLISSGANADAFRKAAIEFYERRVPSMLTEYESVYQQLLHSSTEYTPDSLELQRATRWLAATIVRAKFYIHAVCFEEGLREGIGPADKSALIAHIQDCAPTRMSKLWGLQEIIADAADPERSEAVNRCLLKFRLVEDEIDFPMPKEIQDMIPPTVSLGGLATDTSENELYDYSRAMACIQG